MAAEAASRPGARFANCYGGESARSIARRLGLPNVHLYASVGSTMDAAHALGETGAPAGTLILADEQTAGRGRHGSSWLSPSGCGIWLTLLERPKDASGLGVLSLRAGLAAARALDPFAAAPIQVKWPNDLFVAGGKVAGVLVEARWRGGHPDWVAIGLGVNVAPPHGVPGAAGLREGTSRMEVVESVVSAVRDAAKQRGLLDAGEMIEYAGRDYARGRRCVTPVRGGVVGITADGDLLVRTAHGVQHCRAGSLVLEEGA